MTFDDLIRESKAQWGQRSSSLSDLPVFRSQKRIALRNCGRIDPEDIRHYIAQGGYGGLAGAMKMTPDEVVRQVEVSGLRGRGGAGFPVAKKWRACRESPGHEKYVVCNAAESDPRAFKDRTLLEGDPHAVLEGILISAYAVGADRGYVYVNPRYDRALACLNTAVAQMGRHHLIGEKIIGSDFRFHLEIVTGVEGLVNGEESAMLSHMDGGPLTAFARPPFPAESGVGGAPTLVQNVETFAHVSAILEKGGAWYSGVGLEDDTGTKVLSLDGAVERPDVIEVPMGTSLRQIVYDIGGGPGDASDIKAVQVGGIAGGWILPEELDTALDHKGLEAAGTMMGSGSIFVAPSDSCAVDLARESLAFISAQACGKCVFGREGTRQMAGILTDITSGRGRKEDIDLLMSLCEGMKIASLCGLGKAAPYPVESTIRLFREEYEAHIREKKCPASVCKDLAG